MARLKQRGVVRDSGCELVADFTAARFEHGLVSGGFQMENQTQCADLPP